MLNIVKCMYMAKNQILVDLIKTIKYKSNLNQSQIAAAIGVSKQYLSDTINGRFPFTDELKAKLYEHYTYLADKGQEAENVPRMSYTEGKPYYNVDFTGGFDIVLNDQTAKPDYLIDFKKYREADCWCNITGHSMEPLISNGDIIAIKELKNWRDFILYGEAYGIVTEDMRTVKIVTKSEKGDGYLHLVPVNKSVEYQPQDIPIKLITHVFKILGCMKKL